MNTVKSISQQLEEQEKTLQKIRENKKTLQRVMKIYPDAVSLTIENGESVYASRKVKLDLNPEVILNISPDGTRRQFYVRGTITIGSLKIYSYESTMLDSRLMFKMLSAFTKTAPGKKMITESCSSIQVAVRQVA